MAIDQCRWRRTELPKDDEDRRTPEERTVRCELDRHADGLHEVTVDGVKYRWRSTLRGRLLMATDPATEAQLDLACEAFTDNFTKGNREGIRAAIATAAPLIRRQAFNEAEQSVRDVVGDCSGPEAFEVAILAVRGLGEKENANG